VSGATVLATWVASVLTAPVTHHAPMTALSADERQLGSEVGDLSQEAGRLARQVPASVSFSLPARDLFRFRAAPASLPTVTPDAALRISDELLVPEPVEVPASLLLTGMAEDRSGGIVVRTAVVSGPDQAWLVKDGDVIDGWFRVTSIEADTVGIVRADTGATVRLTFRP
jgi:hypothetical protein